ncbi:alkaline phosphatase family protein [Hwangdonia lutea]|uniref:Alkaline phosphatase family protein n=1 Tax=Hwangdonia lutea TaxID=3075823 RepID=A0AA97HQE0_9FLAO|nr:alkaline phosphatase family protein [Hwangdonia sp. SCSIO 19198]WOD43876.1 alkaline phosphatase family protein [Hwangdonia sp. SCSIO 19198]
MKLQLKYYVFLTLTIAFSFSEIKAQNKVLILGIDGCRPDALLAAKTPHLDNLWKNGAYSFKAKTDDLSWSGVCWTGMLTGVWKDKHKVMGNQYLNPNIKEYPHFFNLAKQQQPDLRTYSIANWSPVHKILQYNDATVVKHKPTDGLVTKSVVKTLKNEDVDVMFVHLDNVDHAGHKYGYAIDNSKYIKSIEKTDKKIGRIVKALQKRKNYANENWLILVSTDHGGSGTNHGKAIPEHTTIFYIASGKDVEKGEIKKQVYVIDVAVTALKHLNIDLKEAWNLDGNVSGLK